MRRLGQVLNCKKEIRGKFIIGIDFFFLIIGNKNIQLQKIFLKLKKKNGFDIFPLKLNSKFLNSK